MIMILRKCINICGSIMNYSHGRIWFVKMIDNSIHWVKNQIQILSHTFLMKNTVFLQLIALLLITKWYFLILKLFNHLLSMRLPPINVHFELSHSFCSVLHVLILNETLHSTSWQLNLPFLI
jgi:hypothetical protein